jgi:CelD/BcsL family acetyltransferase involved in cellulose biosynthesis
VSKPSSHPAAVRVLKPAELQSHHLLAWRSMVVENPQLSSPFFSLEYSLAVARVIPHVWIGVLEQKGTPVAFLAFERSAGGIGKRIRLCDYQGLVSKPGLAFDVRWFIHECGLRTWDFNHLLATQEVFQPFHLGCGVSPIMDISNGYAAYLEERRITGRMELIKRCAGKLRKLERETGEVRLEIHREDSDILQQLLTWRAAKYESHHSQELLVSVLQSLLPVQTGQMKSTLSVLYAGDHLVAAHFGLRSESTWHWWFPAYNPLFEKYSPGTNLLLKMAGSAEEAGVKVIDFGKGDQDYKKQLMTGSIPIAEGYVSASKWLSLSRRFKRETKRCLRQTPILGTLARKMYHVASGA